MWYFWSGGGGGGVEGGDLDDGSSLALLSYHLKQHFFGTGLIASSSVAVLVLVVPSPPVWVS